MTISCSTCRFFVTRRCHRHPTVVRVEADYWCGEHADAEPAEAHDVELPPEGVEVTVIAQPKKAKRISGRKLVDG